MIMRIVNAVMFLVFVFAIAVQYNDPDPIRWMFFYAVAAAFTLAAAFHRYTGVVWLAALGFVAGTIYWLPGVDLSSPRSLVTDVRMNSLAVEETREALGLLICAAWMSVLGIVWFRTRNLAPSPTQDAPAENTR